MNLIKNILKIQISLTIFIMVITYDAHAKCSKKDIDYYLEKGFTTEQITGICSEEPLITNSSKRDELYRSFNEEYADEQDEEYLKEMRIQRQVFLKSAIAAQQIKIKGTNLSFLSTLCGRNSLKKSGTSDKATIEGCAEIRTTIDLANIEVSKKMKREKVIMGAKQILVKGKIEHKIVGGMTNLTTFEKNILEPLLIKKIRKNEARIPIKSGLDFTYALENFNDLVDFHKGLSLKIGKNKDLGGNLEIEDFDVKNNKYIIEDAEKKLKLSNEVDDTIDDNIVFDDLSTTQKESDEIPEDIFN